MYVHCPRGRKRKSFVHWMIWIKHTFFQSVNFTSPTTNLADSSSSFRMVGGTSSVKRYIVHGQSAASDTPSPTARKNVLVLWTGLFLESPFPVRAISDSPAWSFVAVADDAYGVVGPLSRCSLSSAAAPLREAQFPGRAGGGGSGR